MSATCQVLGPIVIRIDGADPPADLFWKKNVALLLYLALSPHRTRTRDQIVGMLWADRSDAAARQSAREAIRTLRRHLGSDALETQGDAVRLAAPDLQLDTDDFTRAVESGEWPAAADAIRGQFAEGFAVPDCAEFDRWLSAERATWSRRLVDALVRAGAASLDTADLTRAVEFAERALALDRGAEDAVAVAMRADALTGRRAHALQHFEDLSAYLADLDAEPSRDLAALADRIRCDRTSQRRAKRVAEPAEPRDTTLVGRLDALTRCLRSWSACRSRPGPGVVIIEGDPGCGKTRLAEEVLHRVRLDGASTVTLRCVSGDREHDGSGLVGLVHSELIHAPGVGSAPPEALASLASVAPEWGDAFPHVTSSTTWSPDRAVGAAVEAAVTERPVALLLDDAQWLDETSLHLVLTLLRDLSGSPLYVIFTTTAPRDELDQLRAHLGETVVGDGVHLDPLDREDVRSLVDEQLSDLPEDQRARIARRLFADSGGIPLLVVELLRAVAAGMELSDPHPGWPIADRTLDQTRPGDLPPSVIGAVRVRFRAVSKLAQDVLRVLAAGGERLSAARIRAAAGGGANAVDAALDELEWERFIQCDRRGYAFVARIVREVILEDLMTAGQRERIRRSLEDDTGVPPSSPDST